MPQLTRRVGVLCWKGQVSLTSNFDAVERGYAYGRGKPQHRVLQLCLNELYLEERMENPMPNGIVKYNGILSEGKKMQTPLITNVKFEKNGNMILY